MIDLHSHILPGIDDGAQTLDISLAMAKIAVNDGIQLMACTPHIYPGLYMNTADGINRHVVALQAELDQAGIGLRLVCGADVHLVPGLMGDIRKGDVPTIHRSRYLLLEPSHHVAPPRFEELVFEFVAAGLTPVITHPERLTWIEDHFETFARMTRQGAWMQVTAGALTGMFGQRAKYWGEKFLGEGLTHIIASDAHSAKRRVPVLSEAKEMARKLLGPDEAEQLVLYRPQAILDNLLPSQVKGLPSKPVKQSWIQRVLG